MGAVKCAQVGSLLAVLSLAHHFAQREMSPSMPCVFSTGHRLLTYRDSNAFIANSLKSYGHVTSRIGFTLTGFSPLISHVQNLLSGERP